MSKFIVYIIENNRKKGTFNKMTTLEANSSNNALPNFYLFT